VRELDLCAMPNQEKHDRSVECETHGSAFQTFIRVHLAADPRQVWYSSRANEQDRWPDSWCSICHEAFQQQGEWNDKNENGLTIKLLCHRCYESRRAQGTHVEVPDESGTQI
jgi:hypothetical protein